MNNAQTHDTNIVKIKTRKKRTNQVATLNNDKITETKLIFLGEYLNIHTFQKHIITQSFIESEAKKLRDWANLEDSLLIQDFADKQGYRRTLFYEWVEKYPTFAIAHEYALSRLGSRREIGAMTRRFAEATTHRTLSHYQDIWKNETIALSKLKEDNSVQNEQRVVIIERFPAIEERKKTPEEVASAIKKSTEDSRLVGGCEYNIKRRNEE
jgi:hypothetical protein